MVDLNLVSSLWRLVYALTDTCVYQTKLYRFISHAPSPLCVMSCRYVTFYGTSVIDIRNTAHLQRHQKKNLKGGLTYICDIQIGGTRWSKALPEHITQYGTAQVSSQEHRLVTNGLAVQRVQSTAVEEKRSQRNALFKQLVDKNFMGKVRKQC